MANSKEAAPASAIMMCLLFGTNCLLFFLFQAIKMSSKPTEEVKKSNKEKELSKPFLGTLECFTNLTSELFRTGLVIFMTYVCERHWIFEHATKSYSRDLFLFVLIVFFAYGLYTIKPVHDLTLLGREQTEEWKGWMQFIFLLYHYFHAEEVYNSVRVMITCYVWMTGFGNFSFFYIKQDFGWLRVAQMMWRLNFSVLLLMWAHGNTYILYYICPMHTFYFLMVYATMYVFSSVNNSKWGIRVKLMLVGILIYIVWDINGGIFDFLFAWLGTDKVVGANNGSVWEYYFRTSLDHWSSFLGMIFALNFPLAEQYFVKAKGLPLYISSVVMAIATVWWLVTCYSQEKLAYNLTHSYFAIIPLTAYIFFRNITPAVRSGVSMSFHDLGKTTLETYLLQHHIWLTSNAKTLLNITPGNPWINFALATILFFTVSKELYRLTMSLRGMIMPEDKNVTFTNCIGLGVILLAAYTIALFLHSLSPTLLEIFLACLGLMLVSMLAINRLTKLAENGLYQLWSTRALVFVGFTFAGGIVMQLILNASNGSNGAVVTTSTTPYIGNTPQCLESISSGHWVKEKCSPTDPAVKTNKQVYCNTEKWLWDNAACPVSKIAPSKLRTIFKGKRVAFVGDSLIRSTYHEFISLIEPDYKQNRSFTLKHSNIDYELNSKPTSTNSTTITTTTTNGLISFIWAPFIENVANAYKEQLTAVDPTTSTKKFTYDMIVVGVGYWDALHKHNVEAYKTALDLLAGVYEPLREVSANTVNIWLLPTTVIDNLLPTPEKQQFMNEEAMTKYKDAFLSSKAATSLFRTVVNPVNVSRSREAGSVDGVHYTPEVYQVIAHMISNGYALHFPQLIGKSTATSGKPYVPKVTGSMSSPYHGALLLVLSFVMLFSMDSFLGVGFFSLVVCGRSYDWEAAYGPLHKKIGNTRNQQQQNEGSQRDAEVGGNAA
eukprot:CAMPEP_0170084900 /NCGR_PEP_ID=MMETSP0019_2-20121128/19944_1 /TAXON_ID=98059 /ORGANISM="Dinobryon sp., Strain UTEXLB2267" /LENGTH=942 /DNA_ID=CAMNT_0010301145 /DNA_START=80 /DNA_END=2908 /DNA_ORIENTATION=+